MFSSLLVEWQHFVPRQHGFATPFYKGQRHQQVQVPYLYTQSAAVPVFPIPKEKEYSKTQAREPATPEGADPPKFWLSVPVAAEPPSFRHRSSQFYEAYYVFKYEVLIYLF